jgi:hypothetical protein
MKVVSSRRIIRERLKLISWGVGKIIRPLKGLSGSFRTIGSGLLNKRKN